MEEENKSTRCHKPRTYREDFKKSVVEDYEARIGQYASTSAFAREKDIPDNTLFGWLKKYGSGQQSAASERMAIGRNLRSAKKGRTEMCKVSIGGVSVEGEAGSLAAVIGAMSHADD